jgi:hypothetical protein
MLILFFQIHSEIIVAHIFYDYQFLTLQNTSASYLHSGFQRMIWINNNIDWISGLESSPSYRSYEQLKFVYSIGTKFADTCQAENSDYNEQTIVPNVPRLDVCNERLNNIEWQFHDGRKIILLKTVLHLVPFYSR